MFQWHPSGIVLRVNNKFIVWSHSWEGHGLWICHPDVRNTRAQLSKWPVDLMSGMTWTSPGAYVWMAVTYTCLLYGALFSATMEYLARTGFTRATFEMSKYPRLPWDRYTAANSKCIVAEHPLRPPPPPPPPPPNPHPHPQPTGRNGGLMRADAEKENNLSWSLNRLQLSLYQQAGGTRSKYNYWRRKGLTEQ